MRAVISLGSNIGDSAGHIATAVAGLPGTLVAVSGLYSTPPWGGVEQDDFLNATAIIDTNLEPKKLLEVCQALEAAAHRERVVRWGPRTLDVDIVAIDGVTSDDPVLTLPHPRADQRLFVLVPWAEIDPDATLAGTPITELIASFPAEERDTITRIGPLPTATPNLTTTATPGAGPGPGAPAGATPVGEGSQ